MEYSKDQMIMDFKKRLKEKENIMGLLLKEYKKTGFEHYILEHEQLKKTIQTYNSILYIFNRGKNERNGRIRKRNKTY